MSERLRRGGGRVAGLAGWLWRRIDAACAETLAAQPPAGGRPSAAERRELRDWLEGTGKAPGRLPGGGQGDAPRADSGPRA